MDANHRYYESYLTPRRKLKLIQPRTWSHHRAGWAFVVNLVSEHLSDPSGTLFVSSVEDMLFDQVCPNEPWVGFVHQVPDTDNPWFPDARRILQHPVWHRAKSYCRGLFVLCDYLKRFLLDAGIDVPVCRVFYPTPRPERLFDIDAFEAQSQHCVLFIGEYLRNFRAFNEIHPARYRKRLLQCPDVDLSGIALSTDIEVSPRVSDTEYDDLLATCPVMLNLHDAPANTTVIECISRATPLVINRLPALKEYLGTDYPLFYDNLADAERMLVDPHAIREGHEYLLALPTREQLTPEAFLLAIQRSAIYRALPTPAVDRALTFDVTVVICSYRREQHIPQLLKAFQDQHYSGRMEVILWNNNYASRAALDEGARPYRDKLNLTVIHSDQNFYCIIRLAVAHLMRSPLLLICDDDVVPGPEYVSRFVSKSHEYGDEAILCARGHIFRPHLLDEEAPDRFWEDYEHLEFRDERDDDCRIDFCHADNCLIPLNALKQIGSRELNDPQYWLVDDYWMSFMANQLGIPIWKIRADDILTFTSSSTDQNVALFHNARVREQRVALYVEHMRAGWPGNPIVRDRTDLNAPRSRTTTPRLVGFNIFSEISDHDLADLAASGATVVRVGAVNADEEMRYLVNADGTDHAITSSNMNRLRRAITRITKHGLKCILTLNHLPGRIFNSSVQQDVRIWLQPELRKRAVECWKLLSTSIGDLDGLMAFDLMNEPFLPSELSGREESATLEELSHLYSFYESVTEVLRDRGLRQKLIVESSSWASPRALASFRPVSAHDVMYSFHFYEPHQYTDRSRNGGQLSYPGYIPKWSVRRWAECEYWNEEALVKLLRYVHNWQIDHGISSEDIFVGEFGCSRECRGAATYLRDLLSAFDRFGWSWCAYAFREPKWDSMDYELGDDLSNMLTRTWSPLFESLASRFQGAR